MGRTSNDDRSDSMNPNNQAYWDSLDNQSDQLNPNNERYQGSNDSNISCRTKLYVCIL
jgi:hypothetical protein